MSLQSPQPIEINGWYVVRTDSQNVAVQYCRRGGQVPAIMDGPFAYKTDAHSAANEIRLTRNIACRLPTEPANLLEIAR